MWYSISTQDAARKALQDAFKGSSSEALKKFEKEAKMREAGGDGGGGGKGRGRGWGGGGGGGDGGSAGASGEGWEETKQFLYAVGGIAGIVSAAPIASLLRPLSALRGLTCEPAVQSRQPVGCSGLMLDKMVP